MKGWKSSAFYLVTIGGFSALIYWIIVAGSNLEKGRDINQVETGASQWMEFLTAMSHNLMHPLAILLAQIVTIILVARVFGWVCKQIRQPTVIGEILAGIVLGPSLVGYYFPDFSAALFPVQSLGNLQFLSQIGLILFMFVIGMELDLKVLKSKAQDAIVISHASIVFPFALGLTLAYFVYTSFAPEGVPFSSFALFMGIAMSITAFPVLARIVQERGMHKTRIGTIVITCAAADDITAWCMLAAVIAIVKAGSFVSSLYVIGLAIIYVIVMIKAVRPFLKRVGDLHTSRESLGKPIVAIFFVMLILSSYATEVIGIHALFGAFMAGAIMPANVKFRSIIIEKVEDVALVLLLPLFFVFTGLRTEIGLLNDVYLWKVTGVIILVAVMGKFLGSALSAKFIGQNWKDSLTIGALMNTRGLMELVVLNIGYDLGVLTPEIFAMMVIMALVTTVMTGPALDLINWSFKSKDVEVSGEQNPRRKFNILISFGYPMRGKSLLRLAHGLIDKDHDQASITAMHLSPTNELHPYNLDVHEKESFAPIIEESARLNQEIITLFKASNNIDKDIVEVANKGNYDLLLIGVGQSIFEGSLLGKIFGLTTRIINPEKLLHQVTGKQRFFENSPFDERTNTILMKSEVPVGILIDKGLSKLDRVLLPIFDANDLRLIGYAKALIKSSGSQVTIQDSMGILQKNPDLKQAIDELEEMAPQHINYANQREPDKEFLLEHNLMLVSQESWKKLVDDKNTWLSGIPTTFVVGEKPRKS